MISLLVPTRHRPEQFKRMRESAMSTAGCDIEILVGFQDRNDASIYKCYENVKFYYNTTPTVHMWNSLADSCTGKLMMLCSDDVVFATPQWGQALLDSHSKLENKIHVWSLLDSRDEDGTPHPIVSREYYEAMGYFIPPLFFHWHGDTWTAQIAKRNNVFTHMKDYLLVHDKPSDVGRADETHNRIRREGWHQRDTYVNEHCQPILAAESSRLNYIMSAP